MYSPTVIGVDPGLVHTGVVMLDFDVEQRRLTVDHRVIDGLDANLARAAAELMAPKPLSICDKFIEWYRPRSGFSVDERMVQANSEFRTALDGKLLRNTGVKKVVSQELMQLLHCWKFGTTTHHQDLRSAARIAILGMLQDDALNQVLFMFTTDNIDGRDWNVRVN
jgi:hypothetical protein